MNKEEILKALKILNIKSNEQLISNDLDYWWQIKFKQIQSNKKFTPLKKESLLIELNSARENLEDYEIDKLREILPNIQSKSKQDLKKSDKKKEVLHDNGRIAINTKSKKGKALISAAISVFSIFVAALIIFDQSAEYRTSNNKQKDTLSEKIKNNNSKVQNVIQNIYYSDGDQYTGYLLNGQRNGEGRYYYSNGDTYIGNWLDGKKHGKGTYYFISGDKYIGNWLDDKMHGKGKYYFNNGSTYKGDWAYDKRNGEGTYEYANGDKYIGNWLDGKKHGKGTYYFISGARYQGAWRDELYNGWGVYNYANGDRYEGYFSNDRRHGRGTYDYANGDKYIGDWAYGKQNGRGIYTKSNGEKYEGYFSNGRFSQ
jgi:hypothetical protein